MIQFKALNKIVDFYDPLSLSTINIPINEWWSILVAKSSITCGSKYAVMKCKNRIADCKIEYNIILSEGCFRTIDYDNSCYVSIVNFEENIPKFNLRAKNGEIIEDLMQFDGGNYDSLIESVESHGLTIEKTKNGFNIHASAEYAGWTVMLSNLLGRDKFQLINSKSVGLDFCFKETGCYRIVTLDKNDEVLEMSSPINVVSKNSVNYPLVSYFKDGFYQRYRLPIYLGKVELSTSETTKTLANGSVKISDVIVSKKMEITTDLITISELTELIALLKNGIKINNENYILSGNMDLQVQSFGSKSIFKGSLICKNPVFASGEACSSDTTQTSTLTFSINEDCKKGSYFC